MSTEKKSKGKQPLVRRLLTLDNEVLVKVKTKYRKFNLSMFVREALEELLQEK